MTDLLKHITLTDFRLYFAVGIHNPLRASAILNLLGPGQRVKPLKFSNAAAPIMAFEILKENEVGDCQDTPLLVQIEARDMRTRTLLSR